MSTQHIYQLLISFGIIIAIIFFSERPRPGVLGLGHAAERHHRHVVFSTTIGGDAMALSDFSRNDG